MWHIGDGWGWWMLMGWVWMVVFWGLILYGIYLLTTRRHPDTTPRAPVEPNALEILERRFARGELSDEQFEAMRERLARTRFAAAGADLTAAGRSRN
jgi:putative membrane protein